MFVSHQRLPEVRRLPDAALPPLQRQQEVGPQERPLRELRGTQVTNTYCFMRNEPYLLGEAPLN